MDEIKYIESMGTLNIQPGDVLVVKVDRILKKEFIQYLSEAVKKAFGAEKIVILEPGMDIGILRENAM